MTTAVLTPLALAGISLYRRHISPLKGFRCAYGAESSLKTCSAFGRHVFERYDITTASALLKRRFVACREAYERHKARRADKKAQKAAQKRSNWDCGDPLDCVGDCGSLGDGASCVGDAVGGIASCG